MPPAEPWFLTDLICPRHQRAFEWRDGLLRCAEGDSYPVVDGIPVLVVEGVDQTHRSAAKSIASAQTAAEPSSRRPALQPGSSEVHPYVQHALAGTNGIMYRGITLKDYPIPDIRLPHARSQNEVLLDIGCNWGRWCIAASRKGYQAIGIDPNLDAVLAARDVARQLGAQCRYVVGDARFLPFRSDLFDVVFSYSVLQHLSRENVRATLKSVRRVLKPEGISEIQMLNARGLRSMYNRSRLAFTGEQEFAVRYWTPGELLEEFSSTIGPSQLTVDGFFSANAQRTDAHLLRPHYRAVVRTSEFLRGVTKRLPLLKRVADSLYVLSSTDGRRASEFAPIAQ